MKKIIVFTCLISVIFLSGCEEKVYEDKRMTNSNDTEAKSEYNIYNTNFIDSCYNWYSRYVNELLLSVKDNNYNVSKPIVENKINEVEMKKNEINNINIENAKKGLVKTYDEYVKKEKNKKEYENELKSKKDNMKPNIDNMNIILDKIKSSLELGLDGNFSQDDLNKIYNTQREIISIYEKSYTSH